MPLHMHRRVRRHRLHGAPLVTASLALLVGCSPGAADQRSLAVTYYGEPTPLGEGSVRTFLARDASGEPTSLGVELSESALIGLPAEARTYHLPLPTEAAGTRFTFVTFDWNPEGQGPEHVYSDPHFAVHFYMADEAAVMAIPGGEDAIPVPVGHLPADYVSPGQVAVPAVGVHWVDRHAPVPDRGSSAHTLVYGTWKGELIFIEPVIARSFLESRPNESFELKQPDVYGRPGLYPQRYGIGHDAKAGAFRVSLDALAWREAAQ
jgi:hypothetical protein